jgi:hypothetical protein
VAEERIPTEEELRKALEQVGVADVLLGTLTTVVSLGFHRVSTGARDLGQAKLAIEALRALEPVLREGGVDDAVVRDLEQARANLQLAYAKAVSEGSTEGGPRDEKPADEESAEQPSAEQAPTEAEDA